MRVLGGPHALCPVAAEVMATESSPMAGSPTWAREQAVDSVLFGHAQATVSPAWVPGTEAEPMQPRWYYTCGRQDPE